MPAATCHSALSSPGCAMTAAAAGQAGAELLTSSQPVRRIVLLGG
jgi:hypothetical protein